VTKYEKLTAKEAVTLLDALREGAHDDPEGAHAEADNILRAVVPKSVNEAYKRVILRASWWAHA
jgi:hypothetical protein